MNINKPFFRVKKYLEEKEEYRNSYTKLIARYWWDDIEHNEVTTAKQFLLYMRTGRLTHPESIMRMRRKVAEQFPELAGDKSKRKKEEEQVKRDLGYSANEQVSLFD